jgi:RNA-binding protein YhbY
MTTKHEYEDEINKSKMQMLENINDIPTALKERDYIRARILLNRSKDLLERIVDITSVPKHKVIQVSGDSGTSMKKATRPRKSARSEDLEVPYIPD